MKLTRKSFRAKTHSVSVSSSLPSMKRTYMLLILIRLSWINQSKIFRINWLGQMCLLRAIRTQF
jgi:hypothetical protein